MNKTRLDDVDYLRAQPTQHLRSLHRNVSRSITELTDYLAAITLVLAERTDHPATCQEATGECKGLCVVDTDGNIVEPRCFQLS